MIAVTVIGRALGEGLLRRSAAAPGDRVAVTGYLGAAAAGLGLLRGDIRLPSGSGEPLRRAHLQPQPRIAEGQALVRGGVRAAIDISDGLVADLSHVCAASRVGANVHVDAVPVHPHAREALGQRALELALSGGEDYELLFTAPDRVVREAARLLGEGCPVTVIGEVTEGTKVGLLAGDGRPYYIDGPGWDHFGKGE
jgi:thiamine-monophosphate kinase